MAGQQGASWTAAHCCTGLQPTQAEHLVATCTPSKQTQPDQLQVGRQALEAQQRVLGTEHPDTLASFDSLANTLARRVKNGEAERLHHQVLEARQRVLGADHPHTLSSLNNLANVLNGQGKYAEAEALHRHVLHAKQRVLGADHPDTLGSLYNLANALEHQGK